VRQTKKKKRNSENRVKNKKHVNLFSLRFYVLILAMEARGVHVDCTKLLNYGEVLKVCKNPNGM